MVLLICLFLRISDHEHLFLCFSALCKSSVFIFKGSFFYIYMLGIVFKFYLFIYLFMAVLGLRFCARALPNFGKRGPLLIAVRGPLTIAASLVAEHRLQMRRLSNCGSRA